ncbi:MAG: phosphoglucomutase/phosphomannomutase family protein [Litorilinea sp.]
MRISFGTDGWRAVISDEFTFANVQRVAQAIAERTLNQMGRRAPNSGPLTNGEQQVSADKQVPADNGTTTPETGPALVVGFDTRFLSDRYAVAVAEVLAANGIRVWLAQADAPTPMISYAIVDKQAAGGVMITASHNPPRYNGIKLKSAHGGSVTASVAKDVESRIYSNAAAGITPRQLDYATAVTRGLITRFDPLPAYRAHVVKLVDFDAIRTAAPAVAVDAMYGTGRVYLHRLLAEAGCSVHEIRAEMNPGFNGIHPEPIAQHLEPLFALMREGDFRIGLATDGDADRIGAADVDGRFIDPHCIMALLLQYLVESRHLTGSVVKTVSTTQMLNRLAARFDLPVRETPVGFNHISDLMLTENVLIGGEESGGISIQGHIPEGDGVLMGLLLVEMVATTGKTLGELLDSLMAAPDIGVFCYGRVDQPVRPFKKADLVASLLRRPPQELAGVAVAQIQDRDGVKLLMTDQSWLLIRPSGTEPVLRIYAESHTPAQVQKLLDDGVGMAETALAALAGS